MNTINCASSPFIQCTSMFLSVDEVDIVPALGDNCSINCLLLIYCIHMCMLKYMRNNSYVYRLHL